jgi:hypothetical protein
MCLTFASPWTASAQESVGEPQWFQVFYFKFVPGMKERAIAHIAQHFVPVDMAIGRKVMPFDFATGEWDHVVFFPAAIGPGGIDSVPSWQVWQQELAAREGSDAEAEKAFADFFAMVAEHEVELAQLLGPPPQ